MPPSENDGQERDKTAPPPPVLVSNPNVNVRSVTLTVIAIVAGTYMLQWAQEVFIPIVLSVLISYALEPVVLGLMRLRMPRTLASAVVVSLLTGAAGYSAYALADDAAAIVADLPAAATKLRESLREGRDGNGALESVTKAADELQKTADEATAAAAPPKKGVQRVEIEPVPLRAMFTSLARRNRRSA